MIIHKSHSKNELCKMIDLLGLDISNPKQYKKIDCAGIMVHHLNTIDSIEPSLYLPFNNVVELKHYLINPNPNKILTIKEKNNVIHTCKKIKHFCRNGYDISLTEYKNINELYRDADYVKKFGSIPSVRKAIKELNEYPYKPRNIDVDIPLHVKKELEIKANLKKKNQFKLEVKKGHFVVKFD